MDMHVCIPNISNEGSMYKCVNFWHILSTAYHQALTSTTADGHSDLYYTLSDTIYPKNYCISIEFSQTAFVILSTTDK